MTELIILVRETIKLKRNNLQYPCNGLRLTVDKIFFSEIHRKCLLNQQTHPRPIQQTIFQWIRTITLIQIQLVQKEFWNYYRKLSFQEFSKHFHYNLSFISLVRWNSLLANDNSFIRSMTRKSWVFSIETCILPIYFRLQIHCTVSRKTMLRSNNASSKVFNLERRSFLFEFFSIVFSICFFQSNKVYRVLQEQRPLHSLFSGQLYRYDMPKRK